MIRHTGALPAVLGIALAILSVGATSPPKDDGFLDEAEFDVVPRFNRHRERVTPGTKAIAGYFARPAELPERRAGRWQ